MRLPSASNSSLPVVKAPAASSEAPEAPAPAAEVVPPPAPAAPPAKPPVEAAQVSPPARRGLSSQRKYYYRLARTRQLLFVWEEAGKYLSEPTRELVRRAEKSDLARQLTRIRELLQGFELPLGQAGQPGYHVVTLARQQMIEQIFQSYLPSQREKLSQDWKDGRTALLAYRDFLRQELRDLRRQSILVQAGRAVRTVLADRPGLWLIVVGLIAFDIAYPPWRACWIEQLMLGLLVLFVLVLYEFFFHPARPPQLQPLPRLREPRKPLSTPRPAAAKSSPKVSKERKPPENPAASRS